MAHTIAIDTLGFDSAQPEARSALFSWEATTVSVAELIGHAVTAQLAMARLERSQTGGDVDYLRDDQIESMAAEGRICLRAKALDQSPTDVVLAVRRALEGFNSQAFIVLVNGIRPESLDDQIVLTANTEVRFIRLMPLVGG
ncbi:MAG: hypothetical protein ACFCBW_18260 [Candidatus Competibacterales bacterium]